ncbi:hypothetical protein KI387_036759, partial [Taxus chinensis]
LEFEGVDQREIRRAELAHLEELKNSTMINLEQHQQATKKWFDRKARPQDFKVGDLILKWDVDRAKPRSHSNFDALWSGPYIIKSCKEANSFELSHPDGSMLQILVN